jgi:hypothetical protein
VVAKGFSFLAGLLVNSPDMKTRERQPYHLFLLLAALNRLLYYLITGNADIEIEEQEFLTILFAA